MLSQGMRISLFAAVIMLGLLSFPDMPFSAVDASMSAWGGMDAVGTQSDRSLHERLSHIKIAQETPEQTGMEPGNAQTSIPQPVQPPQQVQPPQTGQTNQQEQPQQPAPRPQIIPSTVQPPPIGRQLAKRGEVSFNFDDADVFSVIQTIFGDILKVNYIVDPNVKGRVNFRSVAPVAREDVLPLMEVILRLNGVGIVEEGGLYRIIPIGDLSREPSPVGIGRSAEKVSITGKSLVQVVPVYNVQSSELVRVLTPFLSKNAVIVDVPKGNYVIIVDTDANVKRLLQLVEIFDSEQLAKIKPQVYVYPVQNGKAKDVSSLLQQIFLGAKPPPEAKTSTTQKAAAAPGQATPPAAQPAPAQSKLITGAESGEPLVSELTRIIPDEITNSLIILSTPSDYELIAETIRKIDNVPRQVVLEALLVAIDLTDNLSFGFAWSMTTDVWPKYLDLAGDIYSFGSSLVPSATAKIPKDTDSFTFVATDPTGKVRAKITAALQESKGKVLAAPHILVSDNREARIQVGSQVPLATSTTTTPLTTSVGQTEVTSTTTNTIQYKDIGIILKVKPQVNDSGLVSLELLQEVSSIGSPVLIGGIGYSSINKTEATTNLVARDGDTIIIGGLIREDTSKSKSGIPILSKIPLLGVLFSQTTDNTTRTELIMLLTPRVIRSQQDAGDVTSDYVGKFKRGTKDRQINEFMKEKEYKKGDTKGHDPGSTQKDGGAKGSTPPSQ